MEALRDVRRTFFETKTAKKKTKRKRKRKQKMRLHTTTPPLPRRVISASARRPYRSYSLSCRAGEARAVAREQRRKEDLASIVAADDGIGSAPSPKQPVPSPSSPSIAQPSSTDRMSPQEVVSEIEA